MKSLFWKNKNVLVTGGSGFIGSYLCRKLVSMQAKVVVIDIKSPKEFSYSVNKISSKKIFFIKSDVRNFTFVKKIIKKYKIDTIFHLAAEAIVGRALKDPYRTLDTNIKGTWNILEASRNSCYVNKVVVASSDKAYGDADKLPYAEGTVLKGRSPYDVSKSCADLISQMYFKTYQLPVCITRCGNVYGGGDHNLSRIIPGTICSVLKGESPIIRSDGTFLRDYIYVEDIANAYITLAEKMNKKIIGQAFNFGYNNPKSVLEVVEAILKLSNTKNLSPLILDEVRHEIKHQYLDSTKAYKLLKWKPRRGFIDGLKQTIEWYKENINDIKNNK